MSPTGRFHVELPIANIVPSAPGISAPTDGSAVTTATPTLVITNATDDNGDTLTYTFEVAANPAFVGESLQMATGVVQGTSGTTSWVVPVALDEDTLYYWHARAFDGLAYGDWAVATFSVNAVNNPPSVPRPLRPSDGSLLTVAPAALVIENAMDPEGDTVTYDFELAGNADGANPLASQSGVAQGDGGETSWTPAGVQYASGTTYYWRARAGDGASQSAYSSWTTFTLFNPADATVPANVAIDDGCGCRSSTSGGWSLAGALVVLGFVLTRRRRHP